MSQSSGFLDELDAELADAPSNGRRSPSQSSSGEGAVTSTPRKAPLDSNGFSSDDPARGKTPPAAETQEVGGTASRDVRGAGVDVASTSGAGTLTQCTHAVIYRGLCGMCAFTASRLISVPFATFASLLRRLIVCICKA